MRRIYHTWDKWECYPAGFYENHPPDRNLTDEQATEGYAAFLRDLPLFEKGLIGVIGDWVNSCEHYLSNDRMNRIAWLAQASACYVLGLPSRYRGGYHRLSDHEKANADGLALKYLNKWLESRGEGPLTAGQAASKTQMDLY